MAKGRGSGLGYEVDISTGWAAIKEDGNVNINNTNMSILRAFWNTMPMRERKSAVAIIGVSSTILTEERIGLQTSQT